MNKSTDTKTLNTRLLTALSSVRILIIVVALILFFVLSTTIGQAPATYVSIGIGVYLNHVAQRQRDLEAYERQGQREIEANLRLRKLEAYQEFVDTFFEVILKPTQEKVFSNKGLKPDDYQATLDMNPMMKQLVLWGSDAALVNYLALLERNLSGQAINPVPAIDEFCEMFLVLRNDVGYQNRGLDTYRLYPVFGIRGPEPTTVPLHRPTANAT